MKTPKIPEKYDYKWDRKLNDFPLREVGVNCVVVYYTNLYQVKKIRHTGLGDYAHCVMLIGNGESNIWVGCGKVSLATVTEVAKYRIKLDKE